MNKHRGRYRGKIINTGQWIEGFFAQSGDKAYIVKDTGIAVGYMTMKEIVPETVCETTGLHTAGGTEIYENDICRFDDRNFIVKRECDVPGGHWAKTGFVLEEIGYGEAIHFTDTVENFYDEMQVEVIGNVFDNKELSEGKGE